MQTNENSSLNSNKSNINTTTSAKFDPKENDLIDLFSDLEKSEPILKINNNNNNINKVKKNNQGNIDQSTKPKDSVLIDKKSLYFQLMKLKQKSNLKDIDLDNGSL